jgi:hypothetical protein
MDFVGTTSEVIPFTTLNKLYIRQSYQEIASNIKSRVNKLLITRTPGICKSMSLFLLYLLCKPIKEGKRVLLIYHPFNIYHDGNGNIFQFSTNKMPPDNEDSFWNDTLWCLFDTKDTGLAHLHDLPYDLCTFVLSTSPPRELVKDFQKPPRPQVFYMPLWTNADLESAPWMNASSQLACIQQLLKNSRLFLHWSMLQSNSSFTASSIY